MLHAPMLASILDPQFLLAGVVLLTALVALFLGIRDGVRARVIAGLVLALIGTGIIVASQVIVTPAEHGERVTRAFVDAVIGGDATTAESQLADDVLLHYGASTNPGVDGSVLRDAIRRFVGQYTIDEHRNLKLEGTDDGDDAATIELACLTSAESSAGAAHTVWELRVERIGDDWRITDVTWIALNKGAPPRTLR